jgi:hypothetical protein
MKTEPPSWNLLLISSPLEKRNIEEPPRQYTFMPLLLLFLIALPSSALFNKARTTADYKIKAALDTPKIRFNIDTTRPIL